MSADTSLIEWYRRGDDPNAFYYMAQTPGPEKDPLGKPTISLWVSDKGGMLQLGAQWAPDSDALERLRKSLADQFGIDAVLVRLSPAPVVIDKVSLAVGDGQGDSNEIATSKGSGYSPYTALFNLALSSKHKAWAAAALVGGQHRLVVTYIGTLPASVLVEASIEGDVKADLAVLSKAASLGDCAARISKGLDEKRLQLKQIASDDAPDDLKQQVERLAKDKAATVLQQMAQSARPTLRPSTSTASTSSSMLKATASLTGVVSHPFARASDVSTWFPSSGGAAYVHVSPGPLPEPPEPTPTPTPTPTPHPTSDLVRLGFDATDVPIALIQAARGEASATLRSPDFKPDTLAGDAALPLTISTRYTVFGRPYESVVAAPTPDGWVLTLADVGLARITLDGAARRDAKAKEVQAHVRYAPAELGTEDERTVTLKGNDWSAAWYVVTRANGLDGTLEYDWKETDAAGTVTSHPLETTNKPDVKL